MKVAIKPSVTKYLRGEYKHIAEVYDLLLHWGFPKNVIYNKVGELTNLNRITVACYLEPSSKNVKVPKGDKGVLTCRIISKALNQILTDADNFRKEATKTQLDFFTEYGVAPLIEFKKEKARKTA